MSSCTPNTRAEDDPPGASPSRGDDNWVPRTRDQELLADNPRTVSARRGGGHTWIRPVAVIFAARWARWTHLPPVDGPDHPHFCARSIFHRAHLEIVDKARQQGKSDPGGERLVGQRLV